MTRIGSSRAASALIVVDLPVPRSPNARTPPSPGSTAAIIKASLSASCPTMAENGKFARMLARGTGGGAPREATRGRRSVTSTFFIHSVQ